MKIYLAAPWVNQVEARQARDLFVARGITVTSGWLDHANTDDPCELERQALSDLADLESANAFVLLNLGKSEGKAFEFGYAYATDMTCVVVGPREGNIFYHLPDVSVVETIEAAIDRLWELHPYAVR